MESQSSVIDRQARTMKEWPLPSHAISSAWAAREHGKWGDLEIWGQTGRGRWVPRDSGIKQSRR